jgi:predicted methyltransferase
MDRRQSFYRKFSLAICITMVSAALAIGSSAQESEFDRNRDPWQRPAEVLDGLGVKPGHRVADIGCGSGYFTFRLAARVGPEGKVFAVDIDPQVINKIRQRKDRENLDQVEPIVGESDDPNLPDGLDSALIVDTYHEFREYERMMAAVFRALKPGGRLVIIDGESPSGRPRTEYHRLHTIPPELVREEVGRQGFIFKESRPGFYDAGYGKKMYFLIFEKPANSTPKVPGPEQNTPALVAEEGHTIRDTRGNGAQSFQIASTILKQTRRIYVVLPVSYSQSAPERRYPVTVVLDGEANVPPAAAVSYELSRNGQIPESVIIAIPNTDPLRGRVHDLTPPGLSVSGSSRHEGGDLFLDFIEQELLPAVDQKFRTCAPRTFIGHSSGGILVTYAAATRPAFRAVVAIDTPTHLDEEWLPKKLMERAKRDSTPLRYISLEARFGWKEDTWKALVSSAPPSWRLYREGMRPKESHESIGMIAMYIGLREAFSDYSMLAEPIAPTTSILPYYIKIGDSLSAPVIPPRKLLVNVTEDLLMEGRGGAAREAYNTLASAYGAPANSKELLAQIADVERQPPPTETVEGLLATPFPTPEEARPYIGEWVGDSWMNPEEARDGRLTLRIKLVDGRVVADLVDLGLPPELRVRRIEHLRITPTGLSYGFMNGMRPRGVLLFEGTLKGDTLSGKMRFGGVNFKPPAGMGDKPHLFSFKRARQ